MRARTIMTLLGVSVLSCALLSCSFEDEERTAKVVVAAQALAPAPSGAIFTTLPDGTRVNANIYESKKDVYLDGGPNGDQTPAAALDDGDYVFQVTDPSGKTLLSTDAAGCRVVRVEGGVIMYLLDWDGEGVEPSDFTIHDSNHQCHRAGQQHGKHDTNADSDNPDVDDIVVQLMPFDDTPNPGGVYKAWMTRVGHYVCDLSEVDCGYDMGATYFHGFVPANSKTDNFKVKERPRNPTLTVHKYCDVACDGSPDPGDVCLSGVLITVVDAAGATVCGGPTVGGFYSCDLPGLGTYTVSETLDDDMFVCGASVDDGLGGGLVSLGAVTSVELTISARKQEATVAFGNAPSNGVIGSTKICANDGSLIAGWPLTISGTAVDGSPVDEQGDSTSGFSGLKAGTYVITEGSVPGFIAIGETTCEQTLSVDTSMDAGGNPQCTIAAVSSCTFTNVAYGDVGARTPGFWCSQVQRELGNNNGDNAACYQRLLCEYGSIQATVDRGFGYWTGDLGGAGELFDLDSSGSVSIAEAQQIFCPQAGDAEHHQCRRQLFATLLNVANHVTEATNAACGDACSSIGAGEDQKIIVDDAITTVGAFLDGIPTDGSCPQETWDIAQGINENTITLSPSCPPLY